MLRPSTHREKGRVKIRYDRIISRIFNRALLDHMKSEIASVPANEFESLAIQGFFEQGARLLGARDRVDEVRVTMDVSHDGRGYEFPTDLQQEALFQSVQTFFGTYYRSLSQLSGLVARFSTVFPGRAYTENASLLAWLSGTGAVDHFAVGEIESARLFRAILDHPQQFPPWNWVTSTHPGYHRVHVVLFGPKGRGKNPIPPGALTSDVFHSHLGDWTFESPDEVSVANVYFNAATFVLGEILRRRQQGVAFRRELTRVEVGRVLVPPDFDVSVSAPSVQIADRPTAGAEALTALRGGDASMTRRRMRLRSE